MIPLSNRQGDFDFSRLPRPCRSGFFVQVKGANLVVGPQGDRIVRLGHCPPLPTLEMANPVIGLYHQA
jgi:hypothetical protein